MKERKNYELQSLGKKGPHKGITTSLTPTKLLVAIALFILSALIVSATPVIIKDGVVNASNGLIAQPNIILGNNSLLVQATSGNILNFWYCLNKDTLIK